MEPGFNGVFIMTNIVSLLENGRLIDVDLDLYDNSTYEDKSISVNENTPEDMELNQEDQEFILKIVEIALEKEDNLEAQTIISINIKPLGPKALDIALNEFMVRRKENKNVNEPKKSNTIESSCDLYPYKITDKGVFKSAMVKDKDGEYVSKDIELLATPAKITAIADDLDDSKIMYKLEIILNKQKIEVLESQEVFLTRMGINKLIKQGIIGTDSDYKDITNYFKKDIKRALVEEHREFIAHKTGWKRDNTIFVAGSTAYENNKETSVKLINSDLSKVLVKKGTLEDWVKGVSWILEHDSTRINCYVTMSSHLAGYIQQPSVVLQNKGTTSTGKTLKSMVGVSQSGDPNKIVKSADTTKTAAERDSIATDGMCSIFDEVGLLKNPDGLTYLLSNGRKKQRGTKDGIEASEEWYKSFILNGEFEFLKESAAQGEIGRLIECSWKLPTDEVNAKKTEAAIRENYGHITPLFIKKMFQKITSIKSRYAEICQILPSSSIDIGSRLKDSFALIILAGEILEDVYQDIGIERKDPIEICKKLYCENIQSERVRPYWLRGLNIIMDDVDACKLELDKLGTETGKFFYNNHIGGEQTAQCIDIYVGAFKEICIKHELNYAQMIDELRTNGVSEVDKPTKKEDGNLHISSQKTTKKDGKSIKVIRLLRQKAYDKLGISAALTKTEFNTLSVEDF
jgi:uncharacterized protein (DUF927 family)